MDPILVLDPCPCGSGRRLPNCCGPMIEGRETAGTAAELMRSRYTAFSLGAVDYLMHTWDPATRPDSLDLPPGRRWRSLEVHETTGGQPTDSVGTVRFVARYRDGLDDGSVEELSRFERRDGRWLYVGGIHLST